MNEQERQLIEAQQSCKRVPCPHCAGTGQIAVSNGPFRQPQRGFGLASIGGIYGKTFSSDGTVIQR